MKHWILVLVSLFWLGKAAFAQSNPPLPNKHPLILSIFDLNSSLPGAGTTFQTMHPGFSMGTEFRYNQHPKNQWFQTVKFGFWRHQYVQTGLQFYSEAGFRRSIWQGFGAEFRLGAGYLHSIPDVEIFEFNQEVYKEKSRFGRAQVMISTALGLSYTLPQSLRFFIDYQFFLQGPFVNEYVPFAPGVAWHLGLALPFFSKK